MYPLEVLVSLFLDQTPRVSEAETTWSKSRVPWAFGPQVKWIQRLLVSDFGCHISQSEGKKAPTFQHFHTGVVEEATGTFHLV